MTEAANIAGALSAMARQRPEAVALRVPRRASRSSVLPEYLDMSYAELDASSDRDAAALAAAGIVRGMKTALMVRPGRELFSLMFALFKLGAVPVLIDPGIDRRALRECLAEAAPSAFVGIPLAQIARLVLGWARASVRIVVTVGGAFGWGGLRLARLREAVPAQGFVAAPTRPDELAAVLFTSGSTGVPKGVEYLHRHFLAQVELLREAFALSPGHVNMPTFPPFALFDPALGSTSVIPDMDPTRPASADPRKLVAAIERYGVDMLFGSPALLDTLSRHCERHGVRLPTLRRVISAGAPVAPAILARLKPWLDPAAEIYTPYGATECLPLAVIESAELLGDTRAQTERGAGTCVGRPLAANCVRIIAITDEPIADWSGVRELGVGEVGEITVAGPTTTEAYHARPAATALAKIRDGARIVHRMGDLGYFDALGRLWFCGRKSQRVRAAGGDLYTEQVEPIFNAIAGVRRSALVGVGTAGAQRPVLLLELESAAADAAERVEAEARNRAAAFAHTRGIGDVLFHAQFPVDIRHNAKIGREALARWAGTRLAKAAR
ncbi:MAG: peptide synthase [Lysobacterales bacterium 69-70]|nr:AMP-binding protein [Xanthomonadaceae bacterium]ODU32443.1 MAG: peptide synthase [Xanthomonadaceae bacterium SCN 69-320]ODV16299.1 MAG: peptide synthase [Xanthomonadaceae bacterium SCN 69-25]OJY97509.1 MAG: peptide synthase [Xanthomonadales bacterium 69-70]